MIGYIYLIENKINDKKYVGKTYLSISQRWKEHCKTAKREEEKHRPLYKAMNKYGIENFSISEIERTENCEEREKYWISFYDSYHNGYNATLGGDGTLYFDFSDVDVIKKYQELKSVKETARFFNCDVQTIRKRLQNNGINIPIGGDIYSEKRSWPATAVFQYDLNNNFIQEFDSMSEAAKWLIDNNYSKGQTKHIVSNISKNIRNLENRKQAYGFIWKSNK
jgi:hypothetical protein